MIENIIFCRNLLDFNLMEYSKKYLIEFIEKTLPIILEGFLSGQFDKVSKSLAKLMKDEENKKLVSKELEKFHKHEKETILYYIFFGEDKWKKFLL